jgi:hypothetical protein
MKYSLKVRPTNAHDLMREMDFPPNAEDFELHLQAIAEDVCSIPSIRSFSQNGLVFTIETELSKKELWRLISHFFEMDSTTIRCEYIRLEPVN